MPEAAHALLTAAGNPCGAHTSHRAYEGLERSERRVTLTEVRGELEQAVAQVNWLATYADDEV